MTFPSPNSIPLGDGESLLATVPASGHDWSPADWVLYEVATRLGYPGTLWVPISGGSTSAVYRLPDLGWVARVAFPSTPHTIPAQQVRWARTLTTSGVRFATPTGPWIVTVGRMTVTLWHDLGRSQSLDYEDVGASLRTMHDVSRHTLLGDPDLPRVDDPGALMRFFEQARTRGWLTAAEYEVLAPWPERVAALLATVGSNPERVVVHDDLWSKNIIQTHRGAYLIDPDNMGTGVRDHDLAFIRRAHLAGQITAAEVAAFETGYGMQVPDPDTAWVHAYVHRLRWVRNMTARRTVLLPAEHHRLAAEVPNWALPRGPRDIVGERPGS